MSIILSPRRPLLDLLIRIALGLAFAFSAGVCLRGGFAGLHAADFTSLQPHQLGKILSVFSIGLYSLMVAFLYILRLPPINKFAGIIPCTAAILGGFMMSALLLLPPREDLPVEALMLASLLVVLGNGFAIFILTKLGRSFSILPEGRRLITRGPYALVRHPLYLAEALSTFGAVITFWSPYALLLFAAQIAMQLVRMHYEEKVLRTHFPEYEVYAQKTRRLIPWIY